MKDVWYDRHLPWLSFLSHAIARLALIALRLRSISATAAPASRKDRDLGPTAWQTNWLANMYRGGKYPDNDKYFGNWCDRHLPYSIRKTNFCDMFFAQQKYQFWCNNILPSILGTGFAKNWWYVPRTSLLNLINIFLVASLFSPQVLERLTFYVQGTQLAGFGCSSSPPGLEWIHIW